MNTAQTPQTQGGNPAAWNLISIADALDEINADHAFLTALYELSTDPDSMGNDLRRLLNAYLESDPRQKLTQATEQIMIVARSLGDRR
jgi:5S rRNA maturation endonuclease (ribonuclease M5)